MPTVLDGPQPFALPEDVEDSWQALSDRQRNTAQTLVLRASAMVRAQVPTIDERLASGALDPLLPRGVVTDMVIAVLRNPGAWRSESTGPFAGTRSDDAAAGRLVLAPDQIASLQPAPVTGARSRARTIPIGLGSWP